MLQTIRDRTQGVIVAVIVGLISLTFILWGVESYINAAKRVIVAKVDGNEIPIEEFQNALQRFRRQAESMLGDAFNAADWDKPEVKTKALDELINDRVLSRLVDDARVRVTNQQLARQLLEIPAFQDEKGGFSRALYEQRVTAMGFSQLGFEQQLRSDMAKSQLRNGVAASEFVTREEALRIAALRKQKRDIGYAVIPAAEVEKQVTVTDAEVNAYFEAHKEQYRTLEKASVEYLEISAAALASKVEINDEKLHQYYDANQAAYTLAEERSANHILVQLAANANAADEGAAESKVKDILKRAQGGEDFEKLAKELSDDVGSKAEGGSTGFFARGAMAPEFEEAAFKLKVGEISAPVRTKFGWHIIKLKDIKAGGLQPYDKVKAEVEMAYRNSEAQKAFFEQAEQFSNLVYEHSDSLGVAAETLGIATQKTEVMSKEEFAKKFSDKAANAIFTAEVLNEGMNSEPIELPDSRVIAVRVLDHVPSAIPELAVVKTEVEDAVRNQHRRELTEALGKELIEKLRKGETVTELVKGRGFGWEQEEGVTRESGDVNRAVLRAAFSAEVAGNEPQYVGIPIGTTDYAIIRVANVVVPEESEIARGDVVAIQGEIVRGRMGAAWTSFVAAVRGASDVKVIAKNL
ncbi:MAG: SurA N-terminal domain-containing protein [Proteobacteria bacterium]|nr:SurA N-terminal domain-containing protein [Pseudomonadota bacterium]